MMNLSEPPLIDVLLPVHNGALTLAAALSSILGQSETRLRVLVIDDGSSDASAAIARGFAQRDTRIELIEKANSGLVDSLNLGLSLAHAPYIARHDSDDISCPDRLARQFACLEHNPDAVAVAGACIHIDAQGAPTGTRYDPPDPDAADPWALPATEPYLLHPFLMVRRQAIARVGGYRHVCHAEDTDLYWRLREFGRLINRPEVMGEMRLHGASVSNASALNGRIMAIHSQLAALSARRRMDGVPDLSFAPDRLAAFKAAGTFQAMLALKIATPSAMSIADSALRNCAGGA
jgi:glycosyltransferase involved in cell wall biosynthesis